MGNGYKVIRAKNFNLQDELISGIYVKDLDSGDDYSLEYLLFDSDESTIFNVLEAFDKFFNENFGPSSKKHTITKTHNYVKNNYPKLHKRYSDVKRLLLNSEDKYISEYSLAEAFLVYSSIEKIKIMIFSSIKEIYHKNIDKMPDKECILPTIFPEDKEMKSYISIRIKEILNECNLKKTNSMIGKTAQALIVFNYLSKNLRYSDLEADNRSHENAGSDSDINLMAPEFKEGLNTVNFSYKNYNRYLIQKNKNIDTLQINNLTKDILNLSDEDFRRQIQQMSDKKKYIGCDLKILYNVLKTGSGVCYDFSILYEEIMNCLDINCREVGTLTEKDAGHHSVNIVEIVYPDKDNSLLKGYIGLCITGANSASCIEEKMESLGIGMEGFDDFNSATGKLYVITNHKEHGTKDEIDIKSEKEIISKNLNKEQKDFLIKLTKNYEKEQKDSKNIEIIV